MLVYYIILQIYVLICLKPEDIVRTEWFSTQLPAAYLKNRGYAVHSPDYAVHKISALALPLNAEYVKQNFL